MAIPCSLRLESNGSRIKGTTCVAKKAGAIPRIAQRRRTPAHPCLQKTLRQPQYLSSATATASQPRVTLSPARRCGSSTNMRPANTRLPILMRPRQTRSMPPTVLNFTFLSLRQSIDATLNHGEPRLSLAQPPSRGLTNRAIASLNCAPCNSTITAERDRGLKKPETGMSWSDIVPSSFAVILGRTFMGSSSRNIIPLLFLFTAFAAISLAQQTTPTAAGGNTAQSPANAAPTPTSPQSEHVEGTAAVLKVKTRLVVVDVIALDHKG